MFFNHASGMCFFLLSVSSRVRNYFSQICDDYFERLLDLIRRNPDLLFVITDDLTWDDHKFLWISSAGTLPNNAQIFEAVIRR